ncbi:STM4013/SEN3800 family hydrolase [Methylobacterium sp. SyP6R]|uniref:STM4013/SEN3800 family hydrolase n=1 Tax=Methylobacterium sp. SyP6R TaxID=2718876 RepID=UPI001F027A9C|nr:STM4013/SEN3800 family hydrolase [Methylobacterium sp. SyP6R]MCF4126778.1 STM4013/SEN3800 family hydrolase [Methylobacterium sp. SyP6R]
MIRAADLVGTHDILLVTLDSLRYDVAEAALAAGRTPNLARLLPGGAWERRHAPGSFTYAAHQAILAGFLPTPAAPGPHPRLFALAFEGSRTTGPDTAVFDAPDIVSGLAGRGYHTLCIGGVGFFNQRTALGRVLPGLFLESHWRPGFGVQARDSTGAQVGLAVERIAALPPERRLFLFVNVSATHAPTRHYRPGARRESPETQEAALAHADGALGALFAALGRRAPALCIVCADHGTAFGEDGYHGHRLAHPSVWDVPYAEFILEGMR